MGQLPPETVELEVLALGGGINERDGVFAELRREAI
jgi:hypothetical protein